MDQNPRTSCVLDVLDKTGGALTEKETAEVLNISASEVDNLEQKAIRKLRGYKIAPALYSIRRAYRD